MFPLIWNPLYLISSQGIKPQLEWCQLKFCNVKFEIKKGVRKRGKQALREAGSLEIELKFGGYGTFALANFDHSMLLSCCRQNFLTYSIGVVDLSKLCMRES